VVADSDMKAREGAAWFVSFYVTRWTGDDVRYAPKPKIQPLIRQPTVLPGAPLDSDLWPVVWPSPSGVREGSRV
jgi:hypothetical protein